MEDALQNNNVEYAHYEVELNEDEKGHNDKKKTGDAYDHEKDKKRCKAKGKITPKEWKQKIKKPKIKKPKIKK